MIQRLLLGLISGGVALVVAALLTPLVRRLAITWGAVDTAGARRVHSEPIPRMGGVAIGLAFAAAWFVLLESGLLVVGPLSRPGLVGFASGSALIFCAGIYDDLRSLGAKRKLVLQLVAATIAWYGGARVEEIVHVPYFGAFGIGVVGSYIATIVWILAFTNAINLIDGLDGLAGGLVFFAALTNVVVAGIGGNDLAVALNLALAGAVLGFLFYNFNPARIFMGDTGSLFLGFALSAGALLTSRQKESTLASLLVPIIALGVPLTDTILAMLRRVIGRRSIFAADRQHLHHKLLELGLTHRHAVLVLYGCSVALCTLATAAAFGHDWQVGSAIVGALVLLAAVTRVSRYFDGALRQRPEARQESSESSRALRKDLLAAIVQMERAMTAPSVHLALETALSSSWFPRAELGVPGELPVWQLPSEARHTRQEGSVVSCALPVRFFPGAEPAQLSIGCRVLGESVVPEDTRSLLELLAEATQQALLRIHSQAPSSLVRLAQTSS
jgi:UDP-GlcNAc:undecaprenyl-phosphate GlcNAc-1-phosphate transferase